MEGEVRRLKIELDVYNKTVMELKKKLDLTTKMAESKSNMAAPSGDQTSSKLLEQKLVSVTAENKDLTIKVDEMSRKIDELEKLENAKGREGSPDQQIQEEQFNSRLETVRQELRDQWDRNHQVKFLYF